MESMVCKWRLAQLPQPLDRQEAYIVHDPFALLPCGRVNPMGVVLLQEKDRCEEGRGPRAGCGQQCWQMSF